MPNSVPTPAGSGVLVEFPKARPPKNIVICCDGTGNEFGGSNSNVVKLYTALVIDNGQVGYYHPGVGTMGNPAIQRALPRWWSKVKGLAFGDGFKDNVFDAYRYLMDTYDDGDRVYLFGFSRGAYTVRALAGLLDGFGLLCRGNEGHLPYAWRLYVHQHKDRSKRHISHEQDAAGAFKETFSHKDFSIHFVGVWDTVSSVGWIYSPLRLFNMAQNHSIRIGRHAISIDERRCFYRDNLWGDPLPGQDLQQVWFAGVHSDVGGSYPQEESVLSTIALEWMLTEANQAGLKIVEDRARLVLGEKCMSYPATQPLYPKPTRSIVHKSLCGFWWPLEFFPHIFYDKEDGKEVHRIPLGTPRDIPSGSLVHHSVVERLHNPVAEYRPSNLDPKGLTPLVNGGRVQRTNVPLLYRYIRPLTPESSPAKRIGLMVGFGLLDVCVLAGALAALIWFLVWGWLQIRDSLHGFIWGTP